MDVELVAASKAIKGPRLAVHRHGCGVASASLNPGAMSCQKLVLIIVVLVFRQDLPEQAIAREIDRIRTGIEEKLVRRAIGSAPAPKGEVPQSRNHQRIAIGMTDGAQKSSGLWIEGIDFSVLDIANQQRMAELAEVGQSANDRPGIRERSSIGRVGREMVWSQQMPIEIKHIHHSTEGRVKSAKRDVELAIFIFDPEYIVSRILRRYVRIGE